MWPPSLSLSWCGVAHGPCGGGGGCDGGWLFVCFPHAPRDAGIICCLNDVFTSPVSSVGWHIGIQRPRGLEFDSRCKTLYFKYD